MDDKSNVIVHVGKSVEAHMRSGYCCSEAILMAASEYFGSAAQPLPMQRAAEFCSGMRDRTGPCGVLTGGVLALELIDHSSDDKSHSLEVEFQAGFKRMAGAIVCQHILAKRPLLSWKRRACRRLTRQGAELLASILIDDGTS